VLALMDKEVMAKLKLAMLEAETVAQLAAIIIDYTHEEMMLVFDELEWEQQARIKDIWKSV
jgi:ParB-like chromosome segregation protein Spo0J